MSFQNYVVLQCICIFIFFEFEFSNRLKLLEFQSKEDAFSKILKHRGQLNFFIYDVISWLTQIPL